MHPYPGGKLVEPNLASGNFRSEFRCSRRFHRRHGPASSERETRGNKRWLFLGGFFPVTFQPLEPWPEFFWRLAV